MKIMCRQEYYDKVVQYAESMNDTSLQDCLERLKAWEKNPNCPCEIEIYYDSALSRLAGPIICRAVGTIQGMADSYLKPGDNGRMDAICQGYGESGKETEDRDMGNHILLSERYQWW